MEIAYPITATTLEELIEQVSQNFRVLFEDKIAGANIGDGLQISGDAAILNLKSSSGLRFYNGELDIRLDEVSLSQSLDGLRVRDANIPDAETAHAVGGGDTVAQATVEASLDALGAKINQLLTLLGQT